MRLVTLRCIAKSRRKEYVSLLLVRLGAFVRLFTTESFVSLLVQTGLELESAILELIRIERNSKSLQKAIEDTKALHLATPSAVFSVFFVRDFFNRYLMWHRRERTRITIRRAR